MVARVPAIAVKEKIDSQHRKLVTNQFIYGAEYMTVLPETMKSQQRCGAMSKDTVRQSVAFIIKK